MAFGLGLTAAPIDRRRADGIDALRGLLALWVLFAHLVPWVAMVQGKESVPVVLRFISAGLVKLFQPNGELHPAVVAFIALSGYCIHRAGFRARPEDLGAYAIRRSLRILPVFSVATAFGIGAFWLAAIFDPHWATVLSGTGKIRLSCVLAKLTGVAAFVPGFHPCSFAGNAPLATVMVESWLYVVYGLAFAALVWRGREILVAIICAVVFAVGLIVATLAQRHPLLYSWWPNSSIWGFLPYWWLGTIFLHPAVARRAVAIGTLALAVWLLLTFLAHGAVFGELRKLAFCCVFGALVIGAEKTSGTMLAPFARLGLTGYSLYALHAPLSYLLVIAGWHWIFNVVANLVAATALWFVIERPFTRMGSRRAARHTAKGDSTMPGGVAIPARVA